MAYSKKCIELVFLLRKRYNDYYMIYKTFSKIKSFIKAQKWWSVLIILVVLILIYFIFLKSSSTSIIDTVIVEKRDITEEVSVVGNVKSLSNVDLSFEKGGRISNVSVSSGDKVFNGQFLASVSNLDLVASVEQAKAGLKIAEANLDTLKKGSTPEQIAVSESQVEKAKIDLYQAKQSLINSIQDAYVKADDSIRNKTDIVFVDPRNQSVTLKFSTDFQLENNIKQQRPVIETALNEWNISLLNLNSDSDIDSAILIAKNNLELIKDFLGDMALAINKLIVNSTNSQTTIDTWKVNISTARTNIGLAISGLSSSENQYKTYISALSIAKNQLILTKSGATIEQIKSAEASVEQAQANLDNANAQLLKSIIRSPINGVVTDIKAKVGEVMQAGSLAVSVISYGEYEVEAFIPEADIAKIKNGDIAKTTLDAYGSNVFFDTSVTKIDPGETIKENVPTYKVTFKFASSSDSRIKSGMTANLDILTGQREGVLSVPSRSVYSVDIQKYVKLVDPVDQTKVIETKVETGIRGVDGYVEIISGLKEGDKIIASPNI